ncbi:MAG: acyltransferase [Clostridiales bacterium]|nr:acyltransferase [Clostridiales bacterium]
MTGETGLKTERYDTLDVVRIIAAFFVMLFHIAFSVRYKYVFLALGRFAVPYFFMISGFFLLDPYGSREKSVSRIKRSLTKTLKLTAFILLLYFVFDTVLSVIKGDSAFFWISSRIDAGTVFELIVFNRTDFICPVMWYLLAYIYDMLILWLVVRFNKLNMAFFLIPLLLAANWVSTSVFKLDWYYQGNWLLTGLPFILTGILIRRKMKEIDRLSNPVLWLIFIAGIIITVAESLTLYEQVLYIGTFPLVTGLFLLALRSKIKWPAFISRHSRDVSLCVFVIHCFISGLIIDVFGIPQGAYEYMHPLVVFSLSVLSGILFVILKKEFQLRKSVKA